MMSNKSTAPALTFKRMKIDPFPGELTAQLVDRPFTTKLGKAGCQRVKALVLSDEQKAWLCKWFPEVENSQLIKVSGMSHSTLHRFARQYGLTKSEKGLRGIKRRQASQIKRVCEANGYYDSLRGRQPSEACRQATRQMWQDIRDGKREHPARIMKRTNPRKYKKWMQRKSETRKELIRKETRRMIYGMERKTNLKCIVMCKYTRRQVSHRYNALKRGYIIMEDCSDQGGERYNIYYDEQTERSPIFEKNLLKDGFNLLKLQ
jgi:hypothetical protein